MARKKRVTVDDLWKIARLSAPSLSPDGAQAVALLSRHSVEDNKSSTALWLLSTLGGEPRRLGQRLRQGGRYAGDHVLHGHEPGPHACARGW